MNRDSQNRSTSQYLKQYSVPSTFKNWQYTKNNSDYSIHSHWQYRLLPCRYCETGYSAFVLSIDIMLRCSKRERMKPRLDSCPQTASHNQNHRHNQLSSITVLIHRSTDCVYEYRPYSIANCPPVLAITMMSASDTSIVNCGSHYSVLPVYEFKILTCIQVELRNNSTYSRRINNRPEDLLGINL